MGIWVSGNDVTERMPIWCPPTPPSSDGDVYCETWSRALYRRGAAADALLPPVRWRDTRAPRSPRRARPAPRAAHAPPSLFERAGPRPRPRARPPPAPVREHAAPPPDWAPCEDAALRRALRLQRLPPDPPTAHAPNWDWLADLVNETARAYRSPRSCRDRHDALADPERARRKHRKPPPARRRPDDDAPRPPLQRLEAMREAAERRRAAPKRRLDDAAHHNPKHAALLADHGVDYETPPTPMEVATRRAERIAKEKMKAGASAAGAAGVAQPVQPPPAQPVAAAPQRIVVAAHSAQAALSAASKAEAARRVRAGAGVGVGSEVARVAAPQAAQLLYRQQALTARHHLKILHHASPPQSQSGSAGVSGAEGNAALRTLQLQQLRRGARAPPPHVVLAHLAPSPSPVPAPTLAPTSAPSPASQQPPQPPHHHHPSDTQQ